MTSFPQQDRRAIRLEVEVPGSVQTVWSAVATGAGMTSWFVPTRMEERDGGAITQSFGPGMDVDGVVSAWEPPRRFAYRAAGDDPSAMTFEFAVEPRGSDSCTVRLVNDGFGTGPEWDLEYDLMHGGWQLFLHNLKLYLTHFAGQQAVTVLAMGYAGDGMQAAWRRLRERLGVGTPQRGERVTVGGDGAPRLAGTAERVADGMLTLLLDEPGPGIAFLAAEGADAQVSTSVYLYLFGDRAAESAARLQPAWQAWMQEHFPLPPADDVSGAR